MQQQFQQQQQSKPTNALRNRKPKSPSSVARKGGAKTGGVKIQINLELKLESIEGVSKNLGGACHGPKKQFWGGLGPGAEVVWTEIVWTEEAEDV